MKQNLEQITTPNLPVAGSGLTAACTLFEGKYHLGAAALVNSLYCNGYRGIFYAGYRGELPPWAEGRAEYLVANGLVIRFLKLETPVHFAFCKAMLMQRLFDEEEPKLEAVIYFDPDIVIKCPWSYLVDWTEDRVALCQDVNWMVPSSHPIRRDWDRYLNPHGFFPKHQLGIYFNAGFVGVARNCREFLATWEHVMETIAPLVGERSQLAFSDNNFCFHKADQDAMNVAADIFPEMISAMGPEAMDFIDGGHTLSHAVGAVKPWNNKFLQNALAGRSPSMADKEFFKYAQAPVQIYSGWQFTYRLFMLRLAAAITRFVRRS